MSWGAEDTAWRRIAIRKRDGSHCWLCGQRMVRADQSIDHAIPKSRGGSNHLTNLRLAHSRCNSARGAIESAREVPVKTATIRAHSCGSALKMAAAR